MAVQRLFPNLPSGYTAEPRVRLGRYYELDIGGFEADQDRSQRGGGDSGGVATASYAAPHPTLTVDADLGEQYEYEVLVFDDERERTLVAAVEFVSPAYKDRPEHRQAFVTKCAALLQKGVCVSIVDIVTVRQFNLYGELLERIGRSDPALEERRPHLYAVTMRSRMHPQQRPVLDTWFYPLPRPTAAAAPALAAHAARGLARSGSQLQRHLPRLADRVTPHQSRLPADGQAEFRDFPASAATSGDKEPPIFAYPGQSDAAESLFSASVGGPPSLVYQERSKREGVTQPCL